MKKSLYPALLASAFMPFAALAQDATTTPAPTTPPAAQEEPAPATEGTGATGAEGTTTTTTVPMEGAEGTTGTEATTPSADAAPAPAGEAAPTETGEAAPAPAGEAAPTETGEAAPADTGEAAPMEAEQTAPMETEETTVPMDSAEPAAGTTEPASTDAATTTTTTTEPAAEESAAAQIEGPFVTVPLTGAWRVTDLEGKDVYDANGENIGEISDVLVAEEGEVIAVLVGVGGFLGIGEKDVAVSMQSLEFGPGKTEGLPREEDVAAAAPAAPPTGGASGMADPAAGGGMATAPATTEPVTPVVGEDNLPDRIVLNVTREELEAAPAYEDVEEGTATETGAATGVAGEEPGMVEPAEPAQ